MLFRRCLLLFFISLNLFAEELHIELEKEDKTIWNASYPINSNSWQIVQNREIPLPDFEYHDESAPFIQAPDPQISVSSTPRWGGGVIYDDSILYGLVGTWGSSLQPLQLKTVVFYSEQNMGVYNSTQWIAGNRFSMAHSLYFSDQKAMKNRWLFETEFFHLRLHDIISYHQASSYNGFFLLDSSYKLEHSEIGIKGRFDSLNNESDTRLYYTYIIQKSASAGFSGGYSIRDNPHINGGINAFWNRGWEWNLSAGYESILQPSFNFDETHFYYNTSEIWNRAHPYIYLGTKKNVSFISLDSSIIWRAISFDDVMNSIGGDFHLSITNGVKSDVPVGVSAGLAYNQYLVSPDIPSAAKNWSSEITVDVHLKENWNINSHVILDQEGMVRVSFLINSGGFYVGDV